MQLYPGWSARDNYAAHTKKKKRKREQMTKEGGENAGKVYGYTTHCSDNHDDDDDFN